MRWNRRLTITAIVLGVWPGPVLRAQESPPATRLPAPATFALATDATADRALTSPAAVEVHLHRGQLSLGLRVGERLLTSTGAYEWNVDQPTLETGVGVVFRSGRRDLAPPPALASFISNLPRYELWLGRHDLDHDFRFVQASGRAELNLAGVGLAGVELAQSGGRLRARFSETAAACGRFVLDQEDGTIELVGLGTLGASSYRMRTAAGSLTAEFGRLKPGTMLDLNVRVTGGRVTIKLPPGTSFLVEAEVKAGQVTVAGHRLVPGGKSTLGATGSQGVLRLEVESGWVRID